MHEGTFPLIQFIQREHFLMCNAAQLLFNYCSLIMGQDAEQKQPAFVQNLST